MSYEYPLLAFSKKYMYEAILCAVLQSACLVNCNTSGAVLNIETIGHVSILPSSTTIATYREEKMVGRPCPIIMMNTGKVVRDSVCLNCSFKKSWARRFLPGL